MGTLFQKVACALLVAYIEKAVPGLCSGKKHDIRYPGACSCREIGNCGNRREASRTAVYQALS